MTLSELDAALHRFIVDDYHHREHSETGEAPRARWEADGFVPQLPEHVEDLDLLLLTVPRPRFVHPDGIRFQGLRYLDVGLVAYVGESVTVRYDPRDLTEVRVFHKDLFVCRATCAELATTTISLKDLVATVTGGAGNCEARSESAAAWSKSSWPSTNLRRHAPLVQAHD